MAAVLVSCRIRLASAADADRLSAFGRRVFTATFAADNDPAQLARYVEGAYHAAAQRAELVDPAITTLLACDAADDILAFAQVRRGDVPPSVADRSAVELWRFYVDRPWHGRGVAAALMRAAKDAAVAAGARTLWLGVWERNARAQAFYRKEGFEVLGTQVFMFGAEAQTDQIWACALQEAAQP